VSAASRLGTVSPTAFAVLRFSVVSSLTATRTETRPATSCGLTQSQTLLEALNRHRGKGQQKMTVEHVHVHSGGQAIVGTVERPTTDNSLTAEDPYHARQITHAPQPAMRSPNAEPQLVSSTSDAERPLPYARRKIARRSEGQ
jgi:hypothetical protein